LEIKAVDKVELNHLDTSVDACTFIINIMENGLKLNQPLTDYQRFNKAVQQVTEGKMALIIPTIGEDIMSAEHQVVFQQTVTKSKLNAVVALVRPGVKCDNIRRNAEVIQSI
jgi:hypothetical protein